MLIGFTSDVRWGGGWGARKVVDKLTAQLAGRLSFQYENPMPGFDRSRVKGLVARLVTVKDPAHSTALEVVAGGRLYQVEMCGYSGNFPALNADWPTSFVVRGQNIGITSAHYT